MLVYKTANQVLNSPDIRKLLPKNCKWWTNNIYHFSHVTNIAKILNDGIMLSRNIYESLEDDQLNDNASKGVIDNTVLEYKDYVRFYFRPLTPTQFHNEGIRSKREIELSKYRAHCPVPVFLFFDNSILDEDYTYFSYESLASQYPIEIYQGVEKLIQAPFHLIYHSGTIDGDVTTVVKHRQAEVIIRDTYDLGHLSQVVCRNIEEANTLKDLLSQEALARFEDLIYVTDTDEIDQVFNDSHLHIKSVTQTKESIEIRFNKSDMYKRDFYMEWLDRDGNQICYYCTEEAMINNPYIISMNNLLNDYHRVRFQMMLDGKLVYSNTFNLGFRKN